MDFEEYVRYQAYFEKLAKLYMVLVCRCASHDQIHEVMRV